MRVPDVKSRGRSVFLTKKAIIETHFCRPESRSFRPRPCYITVTRPSLPFPHPRKSSSHRAPGPVRAGRRPPAGEALTGGRDALLLPERKWMALLQAQHYLVPRSLADHPSESLCLSLPFFFVRYALRIAMDRVPESPIRHNFGKEPASSRVSLITRSALSRHRTVSRLPVTGRRS
jgi:hypothetical protein